MMKPRILGILVVSAFFMSGLVVRAENRSLHFIHVKAENKEERSKAANHGMSIEFVRSDGVWGFADDESLQELKNSGMTVQGVYTYETGRGGHEGVYDFPANDAAFHNYAETQAALKAMQSNNPAITKLHVIGKSLEGRDITAIQINTTPEQLMGGNSGKPGIVYMGAHHAREHVSVEVPLMWADYLLKNKADPTIAKLLDSRDIWIIPMVNPDGAEFDVATGKYQLWRKNRRPNAGSGTFGVDLNRNYGFKWGTGGSSTNPSSDVYMGPAPFSEPETQTIKKFVEDRPNLKVLLSFHTFSELILYPWGSTNDPIGNAKDLQVFEKMAKTMANWNGYTPEQASQLYIASGDTTDWAYGEHGIFAFTFELSPKNTVIFPQFGFYPGAKAIDPTFQANIKPCLYLLDAADDPYKVLNSQPNGFLKNYVQPSVEHSKFWNSLNPL